jgi:ribulose-bisphosphate carboxylase large chain
MRLTAHYRIRCRSGEIAAKAEALAVEQSVEMPLDAIDDDFVLESIVGRVFGITDAGDGTFRVTVSLAGGLFAKIVVDVVRSLQFP